MLIDAPLIDRLESSAARLAAAIADAMAAAGVPGASPAEPWCGGWLVALGPGRYVNRAVGVGRGQVTGPDLERLDSFFLDRGLTPMIEVSSWASPTMLESLAARRCTPAWFRNVHVKRVPTRSPAGGDPTIVIREVDDATVLQWQQVVADGFAVTEPSERAISDEYAAARHRLARSAHFVAEADGQPAGCGSVEIAGGVAWLGGAATLPGFRGSGVQAALIAHRLDVAAARGCDLAAASAVPDGASARNLTRHGFALACTQATFTFR